ncbi:hypothetical protein D3C71_1966610 [compost metagenome]
MGEALAVEPFRQQPVGVVALLYGHHLDIARPILGVQQGDRDIDRSQHLAQAVGQSRPGPGLVQPFVDQSDQFGQHG